jgi:hypothetical protein
VYTTGLSHDSLRSYYKERIVTEDFDVDGIFGYTNNHLPQVKKNNALVFYYYDSYSRFLSTLTDVVRHSRLSPVGNKANFEAPYVDPTCSECSSRGALVGMRVKHLNTPDNFMVSAMYYDKKGRLIQKRSSNHKGGYDHEYYAYTFSGLLDRKRIEHTNSIDSCNEVYRYTYDHVGRMKTMTHKLGTNPAVTMALNTYDELGRPKRNYFHGSLNYTDYAYNVRSQLTKVKTHSSSANLEEQLRYETPFAGGTAYYNGSISGTSWSNQEGYYNYTYDQLSRLTRAEHMSEYNDSPADFSSRYSYDKNGNLTQIGWNSYEWEVWVL